MDGAGTPGDPFAMRTCRHEFRAAVPPFEGGEGGLYERILGRGTDRSGVAADHGVAAPAPRGRDRPEALPFLWNQPPAVRAVLPEVWEVDVGVVAISEAGIGRR
jgi:hypothetical protein